MIGNSHGLKGDTFCIFKERVGPPYFSEPLNWQESIFRSHVVRQSQPIVFPALGKEDITGIGLERMLCYKGPHCTWDLPLP